MKQSNELCSQFTKYNQKRKWKMIYTGSNICSKEKLSVRMIKLWIQVDLHKNLLGWMISIQLLCSNNFTSMDMLPFCWSAILQGNDDTHKKRYFNIRTKWTLPAKLSQGHSIDQSYMNSLQNREKRHINFSWPSSVLLDMSGLLARKFKFIRLQA